VVVLLQIFFLEILKIAQLMSKIQLRFAKRCWTRQSPIRFLPVILRPAPQPLKRIRLPCELERN